MTRAMKKGACTDRAGAFVFAALADRDQWNSTAVFCRVIHTPHASGMPTASQAAISGELNDVLLALNLSPLIHSDRDAEQLAREMILAHEKWLPNFAATIEQLKQ